MSQANSQTTGQAVSQTTLRTTTLPKGPEAVRGTVERYALQRPQLEGLLRAFQPLLEERARLEDILSAQSLPLQRLDLARLAAGNQGVPLLAGCSLEFLSAWLEVSAEAVLPLLRKILPESRALEILDTAFKVRRLDLLRCCELHIAKDDLSLERMAAAAEVDADTLRFVTGQILAAPLGALASLAAPHQEEHAWKQGFCPICGFFPSVAYLAKPEPIDLDSLVGGGGQKYLHCSLCGHEWRYRRDACPACENADPGTREMLHAAKAKQERIEACTKCKAYFPCIDLREYADDPELSVAPLGLMHLDVIAAQKGYKPLAPAPWNTFHPGEIA